MDQSQRAAAILAMASSAKRKEWFDRLPNDAQSVLAEIRSRWQATRVATGISAAAMARTIIAQMPEYRFPQAKSLAEWLTRTSEPTQS